MAASPVAVIDIGSNSIKVLVASPASGGDLATIHSRTLDARISAGISKDNPRLSAEGMARGISAIQALLADVAALGARETALVATSAVRDAANGSEFCARVQSITGHRIRILSGTEEASLIGRGLTCDPTLRALRDFYVFDLGGGSLECLAFHERSVQRAVSLQLGCVRLTERFVPAPAAPIPSEAIAQVKVHSAKILASAGFDFALPRTASAIGTGGTMATARAILGERAGKTFEQTDARVSLADLRDLLVALSAMTLDERREVRGLPAARADVFPVALATLVAVAEAGGLQSYYHSVYNLRYGLAAELLERTSAGLKQVRSAT